MITPLLAVSVLLGLPVQDPPAQDRPPTEEEVAGAVARLEQAFSQGQGPERIAALQEAARVPDARVIEWIEKGLRDSEPGVQAAAIEGLRYMHHPGALTALHDCYRRDKALLEHEELAGALLKAIGQHGSVESIAILADSPFETRYHGAIRARLLGLGNIRSARSVEELMALMKKVGRVQAAPHMPDFRLALMRLTGVDQGESTDLWMKWWNENKKDIRVPAEPPKMPKVEQMRWDSYWGNEVRRVREKQRGQRGDDPDQGE